MTTDRDELSHYDYQLPEDLIASFPVEHRSDSRLMVIHRATQTISHHRFWELPQFLREGDRLIFNDSRVLPARLRGVREQTGGKWEGLFLKEESPRTWIVMGQTRGRLLEEESLLISKKSNPTNQLRLHLTERLPGGAWRLRPETNGNALELLTEFGDIPLPPYIRKGVADGLDEERYQTVYARNAGSVAAPTAGLHFTKDIIAECAVRGIPSSYVTLHVGVGTFRPIQTERLAEHVMHSELAELSTTTLDELKSTRDAGGRLVAVGTTSVRVLESASGSGELDTIAGETSLFIRPPYQFQAVDVLLTNFHLPKSTLLVLVSTFAGHDLIRRAYAEAIRERYRFFSYGDAMLIL